VRYLLAAVLVLVGLIWIGQGLGFIPGSFMTGQQIWALIGAVLLIAGATLAWITWRPAARS